MPPTPALFPAIVLLLIVTVVSAKMPPANFALFPLLVLLLTVSVLQQKEKMPPPERFALFPLTVLLVILNVPELLMPPPNVPYPCWTVTFERLTLTPVPIAMTVRTPPPSIIVVLAPEPINVRLMLMSRFSV